MQRILQLFSKLLLVILYSEGHRIYDETGLYGTNYNISVQKCHCDIGQLWDNQRCFEAETFVSLVNFSPWIEKIVNSKVLSVSAISRVRCKADQLLVPLKGGTFYIVGKGDLFHLYTGLVYQVGDYCIEHVIGRRQNVRLDALVCVTRPNVPRCCPESHILESDTFTCTHNPFSIFNPPINKEPAVLRWDSVDGPHTGFPYCHGSEIYNQVDIENKTEAALLYRSNGIFLHWKNSPYASPYIIGPHDYCVAVERRRNTLQYSAFYCDLPLPLKTTPKLLYKRKNSTKPEIYLFSVIILPNRNN